MRRRNFLPALAVLCAATAAHFIAAIPAAAAPAQLAQAVQSAPPAPAQPGRAQRLRERSKESWTQMKRRWGLQREKYAACRKEARAQRLAGQKTRHFLEECMGR